MVVVGTFDGVSILKSDAGGWVNLIKEGGVMYRAQLLFDEADRLVMVFKQKAPESKELYRATVTKDMTLKKLRDDFIQVQITSGVIFGVKFSDKDLTEPGKFLSHFKNSDARVIEQVPQAPYTIAAEQKPKLTDAGHFRTTVLNQVPPQHLQNANRNWSGNQPQQHQMHPMGEHQMSHQDMSGMGGVHHTGGGVQRWSNEVKSPPVRNQSQQDSFPMRGGAQHVGGWERQKSEQQSPTQNMLPMGGTQQWPDQLSATPPKKMMQAWGEKQRQQSNESTQPQSPVAKPSKKPVVKSQKDLENYVHLLEAALNDNDAEYTKIIVKLLVEAKSQQKNFSVRFLPTANSKNYFRLKVTIVREIAPNEQGILFFLMVNEDFTIEQLQLMIETRFSISHKQQHWIIGSKFATNKEAKLKEFGLKSRGAEVHLFISKGEVGDTSSNTEHVPQNDAPYQQQNQFYDSWQMEPPPTRQWQDGSHRQDQYPPQRQDQYPQRQAHPMQNYTNNQPPFPSDQFYNETGGQPYGGGQQYGGGKQYGQPYGGNNFTPASMKLPPRLPSPPPPPRPVTPPPPPGWKCGFCSAINEPYRPGCQLCSSDRPVDYKPPPGYQPTKEEEKWIRDDKLGKQGLEEYEREQRELQARQAQKNYEEMIAVARKSLVPNDEEFECPVCYTAIEVGQGVKLRECLHNCCKDCLHDHIMASTDADVLCPCNDQFACGGSITEAEMRELLNDEELDKVHSRGLNLAEGQSRSYHCKTPDCKGWCIYEDDVNEFNCMVCGKKNCLLCKAIHTPQTCKEYQEDLRIKAANDKAAQETQKMIEDMVTKGEAMYCPNPNCRLIIQKKNGCDWIRCSCRTEICWVTKGPRWGPKGHGDTSGGCRCRVNKTKCHPNCGNCH